MPGSGDVDKILDLIGNDPVDNLKLLCDILANESGAECCISMIDDSGDLYAVAYNGNRLKTESPDSVQKALIDRKPVIVTIGADTELCVPLMPHTTVIQGLERHIVTGSIKEINCLVCFKRYGENGSMSKDLIKSCYDLSGLILNNAELFNARLTASTDKLTGALNRRYLDSTIASVFDASYKNNTPLSVIIADLDFFKNVNDTYGHLTGDDVLRKVSGILRENCGDRGIVGRYGGEEFVVLLLETGCSEAYSIAEQLRLAIKNADILDGRREITISMGMASYPSDANDVKSIMLKVDKALYIAKQTGRDRCVAWDDKYVDMTVENQHDFFSGDSAKDSTRMTVLFEIMDDLNVEGDAAKKLAPVLKKLLDSVKGASAALFLLDEEANIIGSFQQLQRGYSTRDIRYNDTIIADAIEQRRAVNVVDWDNDSGSYGGVSDWQSVIAAPAICNGVLRGVLYISVPVKIKEFSGDEISFTDNVASLISAII